VTARVVSDVELAVKPESVALGTFEGIAALACLVIAAQAISRLLHHDDEDRATMRALGTTPLASTLEGLVGVGAAIAAGTVAAVALAVALSPLAPLGPIRPVYPDSGFSIDGAVIGVGAATLVLGLGATALALSFRAAQHRRRALRPRPIALLSAARAVLASSLPVSGVLGVHFALDSGRGRTAVPVRSVLIGTVLAVTMVRRHSRSRVD
jgi:hypothetical protein